MNFEALRGAYIAAGGQGTVYEDKRDPHERVVKFYRESPTAAQIEWRRHLSDIERWMRPSDADDLRRLTAWPIEFASTNAGIAAVLPRAPEAFFGVLKTTTEESLKPRELSYLVKPEFFDGAFIRSTAPRVSDDQLLEIAIALCCVVRALHANDLVYGDFSFKNILWSHDPERPLFMLDCDSVLSSQLARSNHSRAQSRDWEHRDDLSPEENDARLLTTAVLRILRRDHRVALEAPDLAQRTIRLDATLRRMIFTGDRRHRGLPIEDLLGALIQLRSQDARRRAAEAADASKFASRVVRDGVTDSQTARMWLHSASLQIKREAAFLEAIQIGQLGHARFRLGRFNPRFRADVPAESLELVGHASSSDLFAEAILSGRFMDALAMISDKGSLATHPWAPRAVDHALVIIGDPAVRRGDAYPSNASVLWPGAEFVDRLVMIRRRQDGGETTQVLSRATGETECSIPIDWSEHDLEYVELRFATSILDASRLTVSKCPVRIGPATESKAYA